LSELADGSRVEEYPDGRRIQIRPSGERLEVSPDGGRRTSYPDGSEIHERADGSRFERHADGTTIERLTDGTEVQRSPDGTMLRIFPDGRRVQSDLAGNRLEVFPDGRRVQTDHLGNRAEDLADGVKLRTFKHGYRYWKKPQAHLVRLDAPPESLAVGEPITLTGSIPEGVDGIWVGIFRLPDGAVRQASVAFSDRSFACAFPDSSLPDRDGYYRLQVLAYRGPKGIVAVDRSLVVGRPDSLGDLTLTILPYRSPARGADRVRSLVNRARRRAGLPELARDPDLDRAAAEVLQRWLMGEAGAGGDLPGGDLGSGASVEEVLGYAMMVGPKRQHILSRRWTRMGVAVTRDGDRVKVAQVYSDGGR
jgi:hypothetical protein